MNAPRSNETMHAWAIEAYGGPDQLKLIELPLPRPRAGDVLIRMRGAEVGDWEAPVRSGKWPMEHPFPLVLGLAGSGAVAALDSGVSGFARATSSTPTATRSTTVRSLGAEWVVDYHSRDVEAEVPHGVTVISDYVVKADSLRLELLAAMVDAGTLRLEMQKVFAFENAPEALDLVLGHHVRGKVSIAMS